MRAITQQTLGGPEVLELVDLPQPEPAPTEVLVRVAAAGVNPVDWKVRMRGGLLGEPPFTVGWDVAGTVEALGVGVTRFAVGDRVFGMPRFPREAAAYAEYVTSPSRQLARIPEGLSDVEAAALPLAGLTAWQALVETADVQPGQRVLVLGAAGGVGHLAVQIAKARGAYVIGTARSAKHAFLAELGADEAVDYSLGPVEDAVGDIDVVLDLVGERGRPPARSRRCATAASSSSCPRRRASTRSGARGGPGARDRHPRRARPGGHGGHRRPRRVGRVAPARLRRPSRSRRPPARTRRARPVARRASWCSRSTDSTRWPASSSSTALSAARGAGSRSSDRSRRPATPSRRSTCRAAAKTDTRGRRHARRATPSACARRSPRGPSAPCSWATAWAASSSRRQPTAVPTRSPHLVFVCAFMPSNGQSLLDMTKLPEGADDQIQANLTIEGDPPVATLSAEATAEGHLQRLHVRPGRLGGGEAASAAGRAVHDAGRDRRRKLLRRSRARTC